MTITNGKTEITPQEAGYDESRLETLHRHFEKAIEDKQIQCAMYCLSRRGKVFAHAALGKKSYRENDDTLAAPDDVRYIASITKVFTAVAIMQLVEDGITRLDVAVGEILPQFDTPPYNGINLYHLLTHTSGMHADSGCFDNKYQMSYWDLIEGLYKLHEQKTATAKTATADSKEKFDWLAAALGTIGNGLRVPTGSEWAYCSFGFVVLGAVIEKLTGIHAHKYIEDKICKPLGLVDTSFELTPEKAKRYIITDEEGEKFAAKIIDGTYESEWISDKLGIPSTGGGLDSTVYDLTRFGNMVLAGGTLDGVRVIGRKALEKMTAIAIAKPDYCWGSGGVIRQYGIGFDHRNGPPFTFSESTVFHEGAGGFALYIDPEEEVVASWTTPYTPGTDWSPIAMWNTQNVIWSGIK